MKPPVPRAFLPASLGLLALTVLPFVPPAAFAQDSKRLFAEGSHVFRRILYDADCEPLDDFNDLANNPAHTILIVLGDTSCLSRLPMNLDLFVRRGGAFMLATDLETNDENVKQQIESVSGVNVKSIVEPSRRHFPDWEKYCYNDHPFCPYMLTPRNPVDDPKLLFDEHGKFLLVATNVPSVLDGSPDVGEVKKLAYLPPTFGRKLLFGNEQLLFAVGGKIDNGRVLVLADHSIFINEMMLPQETKNVEFTNNCVNWLRGEGKDKRTKVLFVENGQVRDNFNIPLKYETLPLDKAIALFVGATDQQLERLNERLDEPDGQEFGNSLIQRWLQSRNLASDLSKTVMVVLTTVLLTYGYFYRSIVKGLFRFDAKVPLLSNAIEQNRARGPLFEQRQQAMLASGNLWEAARALAHQGFASDAAPASVPPRIVVQGGWWQRWRTRRHVRRLWRLAHSERPVRVSPRRLKSLIAEIEQLKAALRDGTVRLDAAPSSFSREPQASARRWRGATSS